MSRKKGGNEEEIKTDGWLATYADTITLVLTFFVLLYSFSTVDAQKFKQIASSLQTVLSGQSGKTVLEFNMENGEVPIVGESTPSAPKEPSKGEAKDMYQEVLAFVKKNKLQATVEIKEDVRGVVIELREKILFETGKADIKPNSKPILDKINVLISSFPNDIIIEGHTDNVPISNYQYRNNWQLSSDRALNVLQYFVDVKKQPLPKRFRSQACGEYQPIVPNDTEAHRAMNRRVNILIVASEKETGKK